MSAGLATATRSAAATAERTAFDDLAAAAAALYRPAGRAAFHFARGKLRGDPVFAFLLRAGHLPQSGRLVDLGCGQGVLLALLAAAQTRRVSWPVDLPPLPNELRAGGCDLRRSAVAVAHIALPGSAVEVADIREFAIPACDVVTILDVLHYIDDDAQVRVLERVRDALPPGGRLLLRVADAAPTWRFRTTLAGDWLITLLRGHWQRRFHCRSADQWVALLGQIGFKATVEPMSAGTPFANVLLVAQRL